MGDRLVNACLSRLLLGLVVVVIGGALYGSILLNNGSPARTAFPAGVAIAVALHSVAAGLRWSWRRVGRDYARATLHRVTWALAERRHRDPTGERHRLYVRAAVLGALVVSFGAGLYVGEQANDVADLRRATLNLSHSLSQTVEACAAGGQP